MTWEPCLEGGSKLYQGKIRQMETDGEEGVGDQEGLQGKKGGRGKKGGQGRGVNCGPVGRI